VRHSFCLCLRRPRCRGFTAGLQSSDEPPYYPVPIKTNERAEIFFVAITNPVNPVAIDGFLQSSHVVGVNMHVISAPPTSSHVIGTNLVRPANRRGSFAHGIAYVQLQAPARLPQKRFFRMALSPLFPPPHLSAHCHQLRKSASCLRKTDRQDLDLIQTTLPSVMSWCPLFPILLAPTQKLLQTYLDTQTYLQNLWWSLRYMQLRLSV
jgi:hypothetical protein